MGKLILVIGGAWQGKRRYVEERFADMPYRLLEHYEERIREQLAAGEDPVEFAMREIERSRGMEGCSVILCNEIGNGLVPMEAEERLYRETVGRISCLLAKEADEVVRVICGIGTRLK